MSGRGRASGVFFHVSSLPNGLDGIGTLGDESKRFVDFLKMAGQTYWQVLPVGPADSGCPYMSSSAFAGNPMLIDLALLLEEGDLNPADLAGYKPPESSAEQIDFAWLLSHKLPLLRRAFKNFIKHGAPLRRSEFNEFCRDPETAQWLVPYASFVALKKLHDGRSWIEWWPEWRRPGRPLPHVCHDEVTFQCYLQWVFATQWGALKRYATANGVKLIGDAPIFVAYDSADVWANRELFNLDQDGRRISISGAPPDGMAPNGQVWGHPHYRWDVMARDGYAWWIARLKNELQRVDLLRIDHFRALSAVTGYWEISAAELYSPNPSSRGYRWAPGPGDAFLQRVAETIGSDSLIVEDLGDITPDVFALRDRHGLSGMRVAQFADWGTPGLRESMHALNRFPENSIGYLSTHDTNTFRGWYDDELNDWLRGSVLDYLYGDWRHSDHEIHWGAIQALLGSKSWLTIVIANDLLGLGSSGRVNVPGTVGPQNWSWRLRDLNQLIAIEGRLRDLTAASGRV